jgi:hypothetical protein
MDADVTGDLSNRAAAVNDESYRLRLEAYSAIL